MSIRVRAGDSIYLLRLDLLGQGETARVFPGYQDGQDPDQAEWAVKVARDQHYNVYLEREYETLTRLRQAILAPSEATQPLPIAGHKIPASSEAMPLPKVQLGTLTDGRRALIMQPLLRQPLLAAFEGITETPAREKLALSAARQYTVLLKALARVNLSCLDRKLGDLWWVGPAESGQLVVTDWNIVREPFNHVLDMRRFGLLWFELAIGQQMPRDFQPRRMDFEQIQDKISYGLWYVISRALGSSMGPQFQPIQELADTLDELLRFYQQMPQTLAQRARIELREAQSHLDRAKADRAWIQFDIAQRLGGPDLGPEIERAYLWARDPVDQAAPGLIRKLASPQFSEVQRQLQELKQKAHRPQELGDIQRLHFGFIVLNKAKDALVKTRIAAGLTEVAQAFAKIQEVLVEGVLLPLISKDGLTAQNHFQQLTDLLPERLDSEGLDELHSLELEALFWVGYQEIQRNLSAQPRLALKALESIRATRNLINHWPTAYEPNLKDLDRLQTVIESYLRAAILSGQDDSPGEIAHTADPERGGKPITAAEANSFWLTLGEDLVKNRWGESMADLLSRLQLEPENEGFRVAVEKIVERLDQRYRDLARRRSSPGRLAEQASILEALLQMPPRLTPGLPDREQLGQELAQIREVEAQIARDQQALFQNPAQVLARALARGYELFDDPGLAVVVLKTVQEVGRWDNGKFEQEIARLEEQTRQFVAITNVLAERKQTLENTLDFYTSWLEECASIEPTTFIANTLQLYLATAQAQLQVGQDPGQSLARADHLLEYAARTLDPVDYTTCQNLYEHLVELSGSNLISETPIVTEAQLEAWFRAYCFEECHDNLAGLQSEAQKQKWLTRLDDANQLKNFLIQGEPELESAYFRKKQNAKAYTEALDTLYRSAARAEPMAYALYKDELQSLYERIWQKLAKLDRKLAKQFKPDLQTTT